MGADQKRSDDLKKPPRRIVDPTAEEGTGKRYCGQCQTITLHVIRPKQGGMACTRCRKTRSL